MLNKESVITLEIGMYNFSEEFYFVYKEENINYDSIFLQGILFADYIFKTYLETGNSVHSENFAFFLKNLKNEDVEVLAKEKNEFPIYDSEKASSEDIHFFLELQYSEKKHTFSFESQGSWQEPELYKLDIVNSVIELISYLGKKNAHESAFFSFLTEIANNSSLYFKKNGFTEEDITNTSFMTVVLAYDNFLKNVTFM